MELKYAAPAEKWTDALPVGNGNIGAMVFGRTTRERIQVNDDTCWSGSPSQRPDPVDGRPALGRMRYALREGDLANAERASQELQFGFSAAYQPLVDLWIDHDDDQIPHRYSRHLDLATAIAETQWESAHHQITQRAWVSSPDRALVVHRRLEARERFNLRAELTSAHPHQAEQHEGHIRLTTQMPLRVLPPHAGFPVVHYPPESDAVSAAVHLECRHDGVWHNGWIMGASEVLLVLTTATDFVSWSSRPQGDKQRLAEQARDGAVTAASLGAERLTQRHLEDYQPLWNRFDMHLPQSNQQRPEAIDERLRADHDAGRDPQLAVLLVEYGRYLSLASSRSGTLAANLQGIWNEKIAPPWSSNYTLNINAEMNYWLAEQANLAECADPMLEFISSLAQGGRDTARALYGADGWTAHHNSDPWSFSLPAGLGDGNPEWSMWPMAGAWLCRHLWERWDFGRDRSELEHRLLPILVGAAEFILDWLVEDQDGRLGTSPSTSPENRYVDAEGIPRGLGESTTADLEMVHDLLANTAKALAVTGKGTSDVAQRAQSALNRLRPVPRLGDGRLGEWSSALMDEDPTHRHQSHLYGALPGERITPQDTPQEAEAAQLALESRGQLSTGWSLAWRTGLRARLGDAAGSLSTLSAFLRPMDDGASEAPSMTEPAGVYRNLFCAHPPFQIDGNFGIASAVLEMLIQSHAGRIRLLPALPEEWSWGEIRGVRVRGGGVVNFAWAHHDLTEIELHSEVGGTFTFFAAGGQFAVRLAPGERWQASGVQAVAECFNWG